MDQDKPIIIDDKKFALYGKPTEGGRGAPKMQFGVFRGNPRLTVFTNDPSDPEKKPINAAMDPLIWGGFIQTIEKVANGEPNTQIRIVNRKGPPQKTFPDAIVVVGKDADGVVYLAVKKDNRPTKKFPILPGIYADWADQDGNPLPPGETSTIYALGFVRTLDAQMQAFMRETYEPAQPPQGGGNRGGNFNRGGGGGGNYNRGGGGGNYGNGGHQGGAPQGGGDFDDNLPM